MDAYENEIELMDYLLVIWKRKWLIIIPTFILAVATGIASFLIPPKWEIDAIIQPSKFFIQTEQGQFEEVVVVDPRQVAGQINQESYDRIIAAELNLDLRKFPKLKSENLRDTKLVRVSVRERDIDKGRAILNSLFNHLKRELDRKIDVEMKSIDTEIFAKENSIKGNEIGIKEIENQIDLRKLTIKDRENEIKTRENEIKKRNNDIKFKELDIQSKDIDKERIKKEIEADQNKLKISEERAQSIMEEMRAVKGRIDEIDEQLRKALAEKKQGGDAVSLLLYSNEVQQNLRYYNTLDEKLSMEKVTQENLRLNIRDKQEQLRQIDTQIQQISTQKDSISAEIDNIMTQIAIIKTEIEKIKNEIESLKNDIAKIQNAITNLQSEIRLLEYKKARIDYAQLIKEPTSSLYPVSPRKKLNVAVAGMLGLFMFTIVAFFLEYIEKQKPGKVEKA
ncbi:MAG: Wzz/FepE/Etk N-terminal domain-containing protein [Clostridiales bacterium]|nr:Wzz/FepE/Etk N-terminal domain-containing protein [Clostridiales bacterium]